MSSILDVTEEKIFHTLGRGKAPELKQMEKFRQTEKPVPVALTPSPEVDEFMKKLVYELKELNKSINAIQRMIKWSVIPLFLAVLALLLALVFRV